MVFDYDGKLIKYREESQCNAKAFSFVYSLTNDVNYEHDTMFKMEDITSKLKDLKGENASIIDNKTTDYYLFIF